MKNDEFDLMEEGQHFWGEYKGNLYVFVKEDNGFFRAGNWEGEYLKNELKIIQYIFKPCDYDKELSDYEEGLHEDSKIENRDIITS